jgi:hypothetical protein
MLSMMKSANSLVGTSLEKVKWSAMENAKFLPDPPSIRAALHQLTRESGKLDVAVAFVGSDWWELLSNFSGKVRVVCWLSSVNTNPYAVEEMLKRGNIVAKQHDSMHAKVYFAPRIGAIVGSANLSKAALNELDTAGQCEAALLVRDRKALSEIASWFQGLWTSAQTTEITKSDLVSAKLSWHKARASSGNMRSGIAPDSRNVFFPPLSSVVPARLKRLAAEMAGRKLERSLGNHYDFFSSLSPATLTRAERTQIAKYLSKWIKRRWVSGPFERAPIAKVRHGLSVLFDESRDIRSRLEELNKQQLLPGLRIPSVSLFLYWRAPKRYLPFNHKTEVFLRDFKLQRRGTSDSSPACYANWLRYSARLGQWLELPSPGHVDRVASAYHDRFARNA